mgnify:CR=1 FL=1
MLAICRYASTAAITFASIQSRAFFIFSLLSLPLVFSPYINAHEETLSVGFIKTDRLPYFANKSENHPVRGLYVDLLDKISQHTGIKFNYQFLPQARIRLYMRNGLLDVEPGIDSSWRPQPDEVESSVYSIAFMKSKEVIVYNKNKYPTLPLPKNNLLNCAVVGFANSGFSSESKLMAEVQILDMIQKNRCDTAIFPIDVLKYHLTEKYPDIRYTQPVFNYTLRLRLHKSKEHLLDKINNSIQALLDSGEFTQLYNKYTLTQ